MYQTGSVRATWQILIIQASKDNKDKERHIPFSVIYVAGVKCIYSPGSYWLCLKQSCNLGFASLQSWNLSWMSIYGPKYEWLAYTADVAHYSAPGWPSLLSHIGSAVLFFVSSQLSIQPYLTSARTNSNTNSTLIDWLTQSLTSTEY